jgi:hypothetical protein
MLLLRAGLSLSFLASAPQTDDEKDEYEDETDGEPDARKESDGLPETAAELVALEAGSGRDDGGGEGDYGKPDDSRYDVGEDTFVTMRG